MFLNVITNTTKKKNVITNTNDKEKDLLVDPQDIHEP